MDNVDGTLEAVQHGDSKTCLIQLEKKIFFPKISKQPHYKNRKSNYSIVLLID